MELVYLWVEEYKNIHRQGFNFSPRFRCEFDHESNELTIDDNPEHIENFFGDNINVTAIVGKNGSGKSSLLKLLENTTETRDINKFFIYKKENVLYCKHKNIKLNNSSNYEMKFIENFFSHEKIRIAHSEKIGKDINLSQFYFGDYLDVSSFNEERLNAYNMLEARFFVPRYINIMINQFKLFDALKEMYKFDTLRLLLRNNSTKYLREWIDKEVKNYREEYVPSGSKICIDEEHTQTIDMLQQTSGSVEIHFYNKNREKIVSLLKDIEQLHRSQTPSDRRQLYNKHQEFDLGVLIAFVEYYLKNTDPCEPCELIYEALSILKEEIGNKIDSNEYMTRITHRYILEFFENIKNKNFQFLEDGLLAIDEIIDAIKFLEQYEVQDFDDERNPYIDIPVDENLKENIDCIRIMQKIFFDHELDVGNENFLRVFEYDMLNSQIGSSYDTISDGEKQFINFLIDIIYNLQTLERSNYTPEKERLALFLADEPDNAMHPIWKKRVVVSILEILNNYFDVSNIAIHFILTTHSPFLLSDIPKQNIIFLDTDEEGKCKVLKHEKVMRKKETFGANIHTLLSDSFFMDDGLMGEFAKSRIQEIMDFFDNNNELYSENKERLYQIISSIGEPFLKEKLLFMYNERFPKTKEEQIAEYKAEIERLEADDQD